MRFNKTVAKAFVFALGLGAVSFLGGYTAKAAQAAGPADVVSGNIKFDGNNGTFAAPDTSKATLWGIAKKLKNEKGANYYDSTAKEFYSITEIDTIVDKTVDISAFAGKTVTLAFGSTNNLGPVTDQSTNQKWTLKTIKAADKSFNIGYVSKLGDKFGKLAETKDTNSIVSDYGAIAAYKLDENKAVVELAPAANQAQYEVRLGDGEWKAIVKSGVAPANTVFLFDTLNKDKTNPVFQALTQNGSSLYFRLKATDTTWPGEAKKVTLKKRPNAPKITLDASKDSSNVKFGMNVTLQKDVTASDTTQKNPTEGIKKATFKELGIDEIAAEKTGTLTIYNDAGKGKIQSKETVITLKRPADPSWNNTTDATNQKHDLINDKLRLQLKVGYDITKGAEIINMDTANDYEFYVEHGDNTNEGKVKWTKIKRPKNAKKPTKVAIKYSDEAKPFTFGAQAKQSKLHVRLAGSKQNGNFMLLPSVKKTFTIKFENVAQTMTAASVASGEVATDNFAASAGKLTIANVPKAKDKTYKVKLKLENRVSIKSPKIKVITKVPGVSIKVGKFNTVHEAILEIKVGKKTFSKEDNAMKTVELVYTAESLKDKAISIELTPVAS